MPHPKFVRAYSTPIAPRWGPRFPACVCPRTIFSGCALIYNFPDSWRQPFTVSCLEYKRPQDTGSALGGPWAKSPTPQSVWASCPTKSIHPSSWHWSAGWPAGDSTQYHFFSGPPKFTAHLSWVPVWCHRFAGPTARENPQFRVSAGPGQQTKVIWRHKACWGWGV